MEFSIRVLLTVVVLIACSTAAHAVDPEFGAKASGSELNSGIAQDGGPGSESASISRPDFTADASFLPNSTYLPELKAFSTNTAPENDDDITRGEAQAYRTFTSAVAQTIDLNVSLHGIVTDGSLDTSGVLADVFVYGGNSFEVFGSSICPDGSLGLFMFDGVYFCGTRRGRANLFIPVGDVTLAQTLSFDVAAGETFGVYGMLTAISSDGTADATQTLSLNFSDDTFISAIGAPDTGEIDVDIDVKPGSDPNCFNLNGRGVIPVAVLGSDSFDVANIDQNALSFGGLDVRFRGKKGPLCSFEDVNLDGFHDLVCHFEDDPDSWEGGEDEATLTGVLMDGTQIKGTDAICLVPR
jgi:hypothetical protein